MDPVVEAWSFAGDSASEGLQQGVGGAKMRK
jgi:hypothetical protein